MRSLHLGDRRRLTDPRRLALLLAATALVSACGSGATRERGGTLTISAASSLRPALSELVRDGVVAAPGLRVRLNFGASGALRHQIDRGAPVDLFLSADERQVDALEATGGVRPGSRRVVAGNAMVLAVPTHGVGPERLSELAGAAVRRVAIGAPASVPAGAYALELLRSLGLSASVEPKTVHAHSARQALAFVESGDVDAGIVFRTDALSSPRVRIVETAPPGSHRPIRYAAAIPARSAHPGAARALIEALRSPAARAVLERHGFDAGTPPVEVR